MQSACPVSHLLMVYLFHLQLTLSFQESIMEAYSVHVALTSESVDATIQMKPFWQYFCMAPFVFQYFTN